MKRNAHYHCHGWINGEDYEANKPQSASCIILASNEDEADRKADEYFSRSYGGMEVVESHLLKGTK